MARYISEFSDTIDSRELEDYLEEIREEFENSGAVLDEERGEYVAPDGLCWTAEFEWIEKVEAFAEQFKNYAEDYWHGEIAIHRSYFTEYAKQLAEDTGAVNRDAQWPLSYIDWEAAAEALKQDYTAIDFDGETYYTR